MKLLASSAALFIWLQSAVCGLAVFAPVPMGDGVRHEQQEGQPAEADPAGAHRHAGASHHDDPESGSSGEDHCDLIARTLTSASPSLASLSSATAHASIDVQAARGPVVSVSYRYSLRAPPKAPDLILQNVSFRL